MVEDFKAGRFNALVTWDLDRLTRQSRQLDDWIDAAESQGLRLVTANGEADLQTDGGRMYARIKAAVARAEMERKGARQSRAHLQRAAKGRPRWMASSFPLKPTLSAKCSTPLQKGHRCARSRRPSLALSLSYARSAT
jgi:DNA invertase Pin-like site-specific DNA recombinase